MLITVATESLSSEAYHLEVDFLYIFRTKLKSHLVRFTSSHALVVTDQESVSRVLMSTPKPIRRTKRTNAQ